MPDILPRSVALEQGKVRFFTGERCKHGHVAERYTSTGGCVDCVCPKVPKNKTQGRNLGWPGRALNFNSHLTPEEAAAAFRYIEDAGWHNEALKRIRTDPSLQARYAPVLPREEVAKLKAALDRDTLARAALAAATDSPEPAVVVQPKAAGPSLLRLVCGHMGVVRPGDTTGMCDDGCEPAEQSVKL